MSRFHSYLNSAATILQHYKGAEPFSNFLKSYFAQHKKFGSRDRKQVSHLCYSYFRLGQSLSQSPTEDRILTGYFLCTQESTDLLEELRPEWNELIALPADAKASMLGFTLFEIFPWKNELSSGIDAESFAASHLIQPDLFLRVRPGKEKLVKDKLHHARIEFNPISPTCFSLNNSVKLDDVINLDEDAVVQDYNSQRVGEFLDSPPGRPGRTGARNSLARPSTPLGIGDYPSTPLRVYDCCAASGGKSILAVDVLRNIQLTVSDIRESILVNLRKRFARAGISNYNAFAIDLQQPNSKLETLNLKHDSFDLIICDAPCTGSGTWSRTPEQLYYFNEERIDEYSELQQNISANVLRFLKKDGLLLYVTCSVFKKENEQNVQFLQEQHNLKLHKMEMLTGYDKKADTMFAALLQKM